jgi:hypothetical protein
MFVHYKNVLVKHFRVIVADVSQVVWAEVIKRIRLCIFSDTLHHATHLSAANLITSHAVISRCLGLH